MDPRDLEFQDLNGEGRLGDLLDELAELLPCNACGCNPCDCDDENDPGEDDFYWDEERRHDEF